LKYHEQTRIWATSLLLAHTSKTCCAHAPSILPAATACHVFFSPHRFRLPRLTYAMATARSFYIPENLQPGLRGEACLPAGGAGGLGRAHSRDGRAKGLLNFLLCCRCCQAPLPIFFLHFLGTVSHRPEGAGDFLWRWTSRRQRPALRAGFTTRHPLRQTACDESGKAGRRRPRRSSGFCASPGRAPGHLHPPQGRALPQPRHTPDASLRAAPSGGPGVTAAPLRQAQGVSGAALLHHSARATRHAGPSPAGNAPNSRPTR
jgi:hypothetical protein